MAAVEQLRSPVWLYVPERGEAGLAHIVIWNESGEDSLLWVVFMDGGAVLVLPNERVRAHRNGTLGRGMDLSRVGRPAGLEPGKDQQDH